MIWYINHKKDFIRVKGAKDNLEFKDSMHCLFNSNNSQLLNSRKDKK